MAIEMDGDSSARRSKEVREQINKRLTLNLLIQGAATHSCLRAHYLVKQELEAIHPRIIRLYDKFAVSVCLAQWISDFVLFFGTARRFWSRIKRPEHPFSGHAFLAKHGPMLCRESYRFTVARAREKWTITIPVLHTLSTLWLFARILLIERAHTARLEELAIRAATEIWGIGKDRLIARLTMQVEFGNVREPRTAGGRAYRHAAAGWGGVQRMQGRFYVVARAWSWTLLVHELVKGTTELICLHGLNELDDDTYEIVMQEADRIDYEIWMLQAGGELWRRLLSVLPKDVPLAECIMHIARLDPIPLEMLMMDIVEDPGSARGALAVLCDGLADD